MANIKYTKQIEHRIITAIKDGATQKAAAKSVNITEETCSKWKKKYPVFGEAVERAQGEAQVLAEQSLYRMAARGNVNALVFWLKNRHPSEWQASQRHEIAITQTFEEWVSGTEAPTNGETNTGDQPCKLTG